MFGVLDLECTFSLFTTQNDSHVKNSVEKRNLNIVLRYLAR